MARRRNRKPTVHDFDGPQKTGAGQVLVVEDFNTGTAGTAKRVRNVGEHPLTLAWKRGAIDDASYDAGTAFRTLFEQMVRSGRDSTDALSASKSCASSRTPFTQTQVSAVNDIWRIEQKMYAPNYQIVRNFCGEGRSMRESIERVLGMHPNGIRDRMIEALRDLDNVLGRLHISKAA